MFSKGSIFVRKEIETKIFDIAIVLKMINLVLDDPEHFPLCGTWRDERDPRYSPTQETFLDIFLMTRVDKKLFLPTQPGFGF